MQQQQKFGIQMALNYLLRKRRKETKKSKSRMVFDNASLERMGAMKGKADNN